MKLIITILTVILQCITLQAFDRDSIDISLGAVITDGRSIKPAKTFNRVKASAKLQIFAFSKTEINLYILTNSGGKYEVLIRSTLPQESMQTYPGPDDLFAFDGESNSESILIIAADTLFDNLDRALNGSYDLNLLIKNILNSEQLSEEAPQMLNIGGNFRDIIQNDKILKRYRGKEVIYREYNFEIRK